MPSLFNHESNACWPMRRSYNSLFSSPLSEEVHINKVTYNKIEKNTNANNSTYHISSNGYYGYQPHVSNVSEESSMDVQENETGSDESLQNCQGFKIVTKRKRSFTELSVDDVKRFRQEETLDLTSMSPTLYTEPVVVPTHNLEAYPRCTFEGVTKYDGFLKMEDTISRNLIAKNEELMLIEVLLKQIHGCDLYNFDGYDL